MKNKKERMLSEFSYGEERHFIVGDKFLLKNYRRNTFIYTVFESILTGLYFITPPTIRREFNNKMKVWFVNFCKEENEQNGFYEKINDTKDIITRYFVGNDYSLIRKYDIKSCDELFMVFNPDNRYEFIGVFKPQEWQTDEVNIYKQVFVKVQDEIKFTPYHKTIEISEETRRAFEELINSLNQ